MQSIETQSSDKNVENMEILKQEQRIIRKVDVRIMPFMVLMYFFSIMDRSNIGNARLANLEGDLGLTESQFIWCLTAFYFGYVLFELPSNLALKRYRPSRWLALIMTLWGICSTLMAASSNFASLLSSRIFLGITEAGLYPGILYYLSFWYSKRNLALRMAIFFVGSQLATVAGGLIAFGTMLIPGEMLKPWQWLFILEGIPTVCLGVAIFLALPDFPETAQFLSEEERYVLVSRILRDVHETEENTSKKPLFLEVLRDPKFYLFAVIFMTGGMVGIAIALFLPTIINAFGYSQLQSQALVAAQGACSFVSALTAAYFSDRFQDRSLLIMGAMSLAAVGFALMLALQDSFHLYLAMFCVSAGGTAAPPLMSAWLVSNYAPSMKRGIVSALIISLTNTAGGIGTQIIRDDDKPRYVRAFSISLACILIKILLVFILRLYFIRENRRREAIVCPVPETSPGGSSFTAEIGEENTELEMGSTKLEGTESNLESKTVLNDRDVRFRYVL
ncbi:uncharacterized protein VTP21DRAFT_5381 [Calcarisporiella thermophila]|uniref:uncharacterized protein n=1 Tax=Calcarisporiella thermophila TaxID=911321 RepID=UPI0037429148